jgi:hypothetical protein
MIKIEYQVILRYRLRLAGHLGSLVPSYRYPKSFHPGLYGTMLTWPATVHQVAARCYCTHAFSGLVKTRPRPSARSVARDAESAYH